MIGRAIQHGEEIIGVLTHLTDPSQNDEFYDKYFINGFGKLTKLLSTISGRFDYSGIDQGFVDGFHQSIIGSFMSKLPEHDAS